MLTPRENYLAMLDHQPTDYLPCWITDVAVCGAEREQFESGPIEGGFDGFGVRWIPTESAGGQPTPDPSIIVLDDVCDWEDVVKFPDLDAVDWEGMASAQLANVDRSLQVVEYNNYNSMFLRFTHLLGFEEALIALYEEPEASVALLGAICDWKIRVAERVKHYFDPDCFMSYDDVATERGLFMPPDMYREMIKPFHKKLNDAVRDMGMIPERHLCGYCTDIIPDLIDEGYVTWESAQPMNDIASIIQEYGDRISVVGGYDTQGAPASRTSTDAEIVAEVERCIDEYAKFGRAYCFFGFFLGNPMEPEIGKRYGTMIGRVMQERPAPPQA